MAIALTIIGIILFIVGMIGGYALKCYKENETGKKCKFPKGAVLVALIGVILFIGANSLVIIPTGYTGVRTTFGQIDETTVQNGANWKMPFVQSIKKVNNKQQDIVFEGQVWSETSERAALYYDGITVTYAINPEMSAWIYSHVSNYKDNLVGQTLVASAIKTSSKALSSVEATNRGIIEPLSQENIQKALDEKYGQNVVAISKVVIANADFEDSYNQAVAQKQTAQLIYEQQQIENQKKIETAEADAKVKTTQAQADADATVIRAQGEADANNLLNNSLTDRILQQMYLEKWDGALPRVSLSDDTAAIIDVDRYAVGKAETGE